VESGLAAVTGRMPSLLPAERVPALADDPVTIGLDTTHMEVYGRISAAWPITTRASGSAGSRWSTDTGTAPRWRTSSATTSSAPLSGTSLADIPVNLVWTWEALLAASMAAWLHQLTAVPAGEDILDGWSVRGGKVVIATCGGG
jgi:hypothetical protein